MRWNSEYNRDQLQSFRIIERTCRRMPDSDRENLSRAIQPYLHFRTRLAEFQALTFVPHCRATCYDTALSACCGFESIFTFFADQVITTIESSPADMEAVFRVLSRPNETRNCVYLGENGCLWKVPPVSCAMFLCDGIRKEILEPRPEAAQTWNQFREEEKEYTHPVRPVLFDSVESLFIRLGADSPHMYFHKSPGLLRLKEKWTLKT